MLSAATHILLPQQTYLNVIERKYKRQILMPDPIILEEKALVGAFSVIVQLHRLTDLRH